MKLQEWFTVRLTGTAQNGKRWEGIRGTIGALYATTTFEADSFKLWPDQHDAATLAQLTAEERHEGKLYFYHSRVTIEILDTHEEITGVPNAIR